MIDVVNGKYFRLISPLYNGRAHFEHISDAYDTQAKDSIFQLDFFKHKNSLPPQINLDGLIYNNSTYLKL